MSSSAVHPKNLDVARTATLRPIGDVAAEMGIAPEHVEPYGRHKAKIDLAALAGHEPRGNLILVTALTPTSAGEGKTTTTVGLSQALRKLGKKVVVALREPSLGPVFGVKGGGCGGGRSQILPMEEINLFFNGDLYAVSAAHNLLAVLADNEIHFRGATKLDPRRINWRRTVDMNDRTLRKIIVGLGGTPNGVPREDGFDITAASEVMAILCLSRDIADLKQRLGRILVGYSEADQPVTAGDLKAAGAMTVLLRDAIKPNLVQTFEGGPALVHGGPFANIAHGCNSINATRMALGYADYVVTEAGFASDLGAEKFFDIKCRTAGIWPKAVVVVATCRALKLHGGVAAKDTSPNPAAVERGLANLDKHIENMKEFGFDAVVALNLFPTDTQEEIAMVENHCTKRGVKFAVSDVFGNGGAGGEVLARKVLSAVETGPTTPKYLYGLDETPLEKITAIARRMYGAQGVELDAKARTDLERVKQLGLEKLPVCIAKTQNSLSDDPHKIGRPTNFDLTVREVRVSAGAGFLVAIAGSILTMPGLPRTPAAFEIDVDEHGNVQGLF
jgi:formate--tetrahydrofolate ligase